jgi:uncharacterized protein YndB with AHSA1/START domain
MTLLQKLTEDAQDRQLVAVRILNAPRERVFLAWTNPMCLAQWWGPKGFTNTFDIFEPVEGGQWKFTMHGPTGGHYPNESRFIQLSTDRIIIQHVSNPKFHLVATFEETGDGRTRITFRQIFDTVEECDRVKSFAAEANEENLDRLEAVLQQLGEGKKLLLTRFYDVAPEKLFDAWVNAESLKIWWGPRGFTNPVCRVDARAGGRLLIHMRSPDGMIFPTHGYFQKLERPYLLAFTTSAFEDENGIDQFENLNTVSFNGSNGKTELNLQVLVLRSNPTADEVLDGMEEGWKQSLDKLEKLFQNI